MWRRTSFFHEVFRGSSHECVAYRKFSDSENLFVGIYMLGDVAFRYPVLLCGGFASPHSLVRSEAHFHAPLLQRQFLIVNFYTDCDNKCFIKSLNIYIRAVCLWGCFKMHAIEKECDPLLHPSGETFSIGKHCLYSTRIEGGKYWCNDGNLRAFL